MAGTQQYFITGIGTDVGKTVVAAILTEALQADYWKPIQTGDENSDAQAVSNLISNPYTCIHPSSYSFKLPASPHFAAESEGREIQLENIHLPSTTRPLIIEGAGGILVPVNRTQTVADLVQHLDVPVILVSRNYLGAINHTLLSIEALLQRGIRVKGIIYNGGQHTENMEVIGALTGVKTLGIIADMEVLNKRGISAEAAKFAALISND